MSQESDEDYNIIILYKYKLSTELGLSFSVVARIQRNLFKHNDIVVFFVFILYDTPDHRHEPEVIRSKSRLKKGSTYVTSVRALPFNDSNVKIDVEGRQIIFGFEASPGGAVRPEFTPDGGVWPTGSSNDGWSEANKRYPEVVSALVYANKMEAALNAAPKTYRLEVSPEIAAHMRACGVYDMTAVLRHTERTTAQDGLVYVEIPLNTTLMAEIVKPWHDAGVKYLRVSQQFVGIKLVDIFSADGI